MSSGLSHATFPILIAMYNRILIIGICGGGKSTLAWQLGEKTGLPVVHLDALFWLPGWTERPKSEFFPLLTAELQKPRWIIDGNYSGSLPLRLQYCDAVIWLDFNRFTALWGVIKRVTTNLGRTRPDMGADCPERFDWAFMKYVWGFNKKNRAKFEQLLSGAEGVAIFRVKTRRSLRHLTARWPMKTP